MLILDRGLRHLGLSKLSQKLCLQLHPLKWDLHSSHKLKLVTILQQAAEPLERKRRQGPAGKIDGSLVVQTGEKRKVLYGENPVSDGLVPVVERGIVLLELVTADPVAEDKLVLSALQPCNARLEIGESGGGRQLGDVGHLDGFVFVVRFGDGAAIAADIDRDVERELGNIGVWAEVNIGGRGEGGIESHGGLVGWAAA